MDGKFDYRVRESNFVDRHFFFLLVFSNLVDLCSELKKSRSLEKKSVFRFFC